MEKIWNSFAMLQHNPLSPNIHIQILQSDFYIFLKNVLREFDRRSRHFLLGDHLINSQNLFS